MSNIELSFAGGETQLSVREASISEQISSLFSISILARSKKHDIDLDRIVGDGATLKLHGAIGDKRVTRGWTGICTHMELLQAEGLALNNIESSYALTIVPQLWLLTQRTNYRVFQQKSVPDIVEFLLEHWRVQRRWEVDKASYPKLDYRVQYGESDLQFVQRLLEEAGIAYYFPDPGDGPSTIVFNDHLHEAPPRKRSPLWYADGQDRVGLRECATSLELSISVQPGALTMRDVDFRRPNFTLVGEAPKAKKPEDRYELYQYRPGAFLRINDDAGGDTPAADNRGKARHDEAYGKRLAARALAAERTDRRRISIETNAITLWPGAVFQVDNHPHPAVSTSTKLMTLAYRLDVSASESWHADVEAVFTDVPFYPQATTQKPMAAGVQTATVVGPPGEEVHTDEYGRVRVQFPWDRDGKNNHESSCWVRPSQGWAGTGFGLLNLPRVGQEVLVAFLEGDPDAPVIVGRVFNQAQPVPYKLPDHKTRSTWKSCSSPGGDGFNELMFEDLKGKELIYLQAEKNLRRLVKNDETVTIGHDYQRLVRNDETLITKGTRTEVTGGDRVERTDKDRTIVVGESRERQINGNELTRVEGNQRNFVAKTKHLIVGGDRRDRIDGDDHLLVKGQRREQIGDDASLTVQGDYHIKVAKNYALAAAEEVHVEAGQSLVIEAGMDLTIKGSGGFIRINPMGVTIKGNLVQLNSGGTQAGSGSGCSPRAPKEAKTAEFTPPDAPEPDDVGVNGLAQ